MVLLTMLIIPSIVALGFFLFGGKRVTIGEFVVQNLAQLAIMGIFLLIIGYRNTHDVEIWNGRIANKESQHVHCRHSYPCHCHQVCSGSGKRRSCYTHCDTCYEHRYDVDWFAHTTNSERIDIDTVDSQGLIMPPRWNSIQVGEPTAIQHSFTNYVKGSPDSLFRKQGLIEQYKDKIPPYPGTVYDYYHVNRVVAVGYSIPYAADINRKLEEVNAELGKKKQVNLILVFTRNMPEDFFEALSQAWLGGKKNDFIVVTNTDSSNNVTWCRVMAWSANKMAEAAVETHVMLHGNEFDYNQLLITIQTDIDQNFVRKPMKDFEYLSRQTKPTMGEWIFAMILGLTISVGLGILFLENDFNF